MSFCGNCVIAHRPWSHVLYVTCWCLSVLAFAYVFVYYRSDDLAIAPLSRFLTDDICSPYLIRLSTFVLLLHIPLLIVCHVRIHYSPVWLTRKVDGTLWSYSHVNFEDDFRVETSGATSYY